MYRLRHIGKSVTVAGVKNVLPLLREVTRIGRHSQNDFYLDSAVTTCLISRWHAEMRRIDDNGAAKYSIVDKSLNGTYVNQRRIAGETTLTPGDVITFGLVGGHSVRPGTVIPESDCEFQFIFEKIGDDVHPMPDTVLYPLQKPPEYTIGVTSTSGGNVSFISMVGNQETPTTNDCCVLKGAFRRLLDPDVNSDVIRIQNKRAGAEVVDTTVLSTSTVSPDPALVLSAGTVSLDPALVLSAGIVSPDPALLPVQPIVKVDDDVDDVSEYEDFSINEEDMTVWRESIRTAEQFGFSDSENTSTCSTGFSAGNFSQSDSRFATNRATVKVTSDNVPDVARIGGETSKHGPAASASSILTENIANVTALKLDGDIKQDTYPIVKKSSVNKSKKGVVKQSVEKRTTDGVDRLDSTRVANSVDVEVKRLCRAGDDESIATVAAATVTRTGRRVVPAKKYVKLDKSGGMDDERGGGEKLNCSMTERRVNSSRNRTKTDKETVDVKAVTTVDNVVAGSSRSLRQSLSSTEEVKVLRNNDAATSRGRNKRPAPVAMETKENTSPRSSARGNNSTAVQEKRESVTTKRSRRSSMLYHYDTDACAALQCKKPVARKVSWVQCDDCDAWYHTTCTACTHDVTTLKQTDFHCGCV